MELNSRPPIKKKSAPPKSDDSDDLSLVEVRSKAQCVQKKSALSKLEPKGKSQFSGTSLSYTDHMGLCGTLLWSL